MTPWSRRCLAMLCGNFLRRPRGLRAHGGRVDDALVPSCSILFHLHGIRICEKKRKKWSFWPFLDSKFVTKYWRTCSHQVDLWICWEGALVLRSLEIFSIFQPLAGLHLRLFQRRLFGSEPQRWRCVESAHVARTDCWIWAVTKMFLWCCKFNNSQFGECREGLWTSNLMKLR
jgi:hypothetical protein